MKNRILVVIFLIFALIGIISCNYGNYDMSINLNPGADNLSLTIGILGSDVKRTTREGRFDQPTPIEVTAGNIIYVKVNCADKEYKPNMILYFFDKTFESDKLPVYFEFEVPSNLQGLYPIVLEWETKHLQLSLNIK